MNDRIILHCDANSFYASVETAYNPELKGKAVAVAGDIKKRNGIILTRNEKAKKCGVVVGEAIWQAKLKCPDLVCVLPNFKLYEKISKELHKIYLCYTDKVEPFGIDECWLDVTDTAKFFGTKEQIANQIRKQVKNTLGITISVGVSFCKIFAKLGSDLKKPDATTVIDRTNFKDIIYPLPIDSIIGVGRRLKIRYNKKNVFTLMDLSKMDDVVLKKCFGKPGLELKQKLLGSDHDIVKKYTDIEPVKSVGNSTTTIKDISSRQEIHALISALSEEVSARLRAKNMEAQGIYVGVKTANFNYFSASQKMPFSTNTSFDIARFATNVLNSFWKYNQPVRAIRVCSFYLSATNQKQLCMFDNTQKKDNLNLGIDKIRQKYGYLSITPASMIKNTSLNIDKLAI